MAYEVEREGAISKLELPFVVGVLGDLAGTKSPTTVPLGERKFITIDRDNFDDILARWDVRLALEVPDTLSGDGTVLRVGLQFRGLADFSPSAILRQVPALKTLLDVRQKLVERIMRTGEGPTPQAQPPLLDSANPPLRQWLSEDDSPYNRIKAVDQVLSKQLALIMHDARFRRLEGAWRGLHYLVTNTETSSQLKLKVLNVSQEELVEDLNRRKTFEQSEIFKQLYEHEFTVPGGEPFGALVADYEFTNAADDIRLLEQISHIAAAAFCPLLTAASPALLGLRSFAELAEARDLAPIFDTVEYANWRSFRDSEDSRFVALTLPRVLARLPYGSQTMPIDEFDFEELGLDSPPAKPTSVHDRCCWMNAAYALAARLTDAFARYGWCTAIRGAEGGGKVEGLPAYIFQSDDGDLDLKCPTEVGITDRRETELSKLGFLPLYHLKNTDSAVFFSASTAHRPRRDDRQEAEEMARVMAQLPHVMATSRFCHYLKVLARDRLGSGQDANDCQVHLDRWLANYVSADPNPSAEAKVRYPLRAAKVELQEVPGQPGTWRAVLWLRLWIVPGDITAPIRVVLRIPHWKGNG